MIIIKKALDRRAVLRGLGTAMALPLLDSMVPAMAAVRNTVAKPKARLGLVYVPHGCPMEEWTPTAEGSAFRFPTILEPLTPYRDQVLVLSGLDLEPAVALRGEPSAGHARITGAWLTGVHAKPTEGADFEAGISLDQIAAGQLGKETELESLELSLESKELAGACCVGFSCAYVNTLSWSTPTTPLPMENDPRAVFERLFGDEDNTDPAIRRARLEKKRSILDSVTDAAAQLKKELGPDDRIKFDEYLDAVRGIERRIDKAEAQSDLELPAMKRPVGGIPVAFDEYAKLMFDLQVLAYQIDVTRIITFMVSKELSSRSYPELGVPEGHHGLSHHQDDIEKLDKLTKVSTFHMQLFAYYLDRLRSTPDGDAGTLLDQMTIIYGSGMSNSNLHDPHKVPTLLVGGGAGMIKGGRHLRYPDGTPLTNLYLTVLDKLGVPVERVGDSTGRLESLSDV